MQNLKLEPLFPIVLIITAYSENDALTTKDNRYAKEVERVQLATFSVDALTGFFYKIKIKIRKES